MLVFNHTKKYQRKYVYGGSGIFDAITSIVTSNAAKELGTSLAKTAGSKLAEKAIDKAFQTKKKPRLSTEGQVILNRILQKSRK